MAKEKGMRIYMLFIAIHGKAIDYKKLKAEKLLRR